MKILNSFFEGIRAFLIARRVNKAVKAIENAGKNTFSIEGRRLDMCEAAKWANTFFGVDDLKALLQYYGNNLDHGDNVDRGDIIRVSSVLIECLPDSDKLPELLSFLNKSKSVEYLDETICLIEKLPEPYKTIHRDRYISDNIKIHAAHNFDFVKDLSKKIERPLSKKEMEEVLEQVVSEGNPMIASHVSQEFLGRPLTTDELVAIIDVNNQNSKDTCYANLHIVLDALNLIEPGAVRKTKKKEMLERCVDVLAHELKDERLRKCWGIVYMNYVLTPT